MSTRVQVVQTLLALVQPSEDHRRSIALALHGVTRCWGCGGGKGPNLVAEEEVVQRSVHQEGARPQGDVQLPRLDVL